MIHLYIDMLKMRGLPKLALAKKVIDAAGYKRDILLSGTSVWILLNENSLLPLLPLIMKEK